MLQELEKRVGQLIRSNLNLEIIKWSIIVVKEVVMGGFCEDYEGREKIHMSEVLVPRWGK